MKRHWLRGLLLGVTVALLLSPALTYAQDEPPDKSAASEGPSVCQVSPGDDPGPDSYGYVWDVVDQGYISIRLSGTDITALVGENLCTQVPIGFTFGFYGNDYTQVYVCADGYLRFGGSGNSDWTVDCGVQNVTAPNDAIYGFWWDLDASAASGGGEIYYRTTGTAPNRKLIVEFYFVENYWDDNPDTVRFEIILHEGSNDILVQYLSVPAPPYNQHGAGGPAIGIENSAGDDGLTYACEVDDIAYAGLDVLFRYNFDMGDQVWYDTNQNGIQDAGEPGVPGMYVELFPNSDCTGSGVGNDTTDANGFYLFPDLTADDYCLEFSNIPVGWDITLQDQGLDDTIDSDVDPLTARITGIALVDEDGLDEDMGLFEVVEPVEEVEEFVPEPGSMILLASGLAGLAGYATLRLRSGQALRWRTRE